MMWRILSWLKEPFGQAVALLVGSFLFFKYGIPLFPGSAPVPNSVVLQYTLIALVGILIFVSENEKRWVRFKQPIRATLVDDDKRRLRGVLLAVVPLAVGLVTFNFARPSVGAMAGLRAVHPSPPSEIDFQGRTLRIQGLSNPLRERGGGRSKSTTPLAGGSTTRTACRVTATCWMGRATLPTGSTRRPWHSTARVPSISCRRVFSSGASPREAPDSRQRARHGTRRCRYGKTSSPRTRFGRSSSSYTSRVASSPGRGRWKGPKAQGVSGESASREW